LASLSDATSTATETAFNHLERIINPKRLGHVTTARLTEFQRQLREEKMKDTTLACHLRHIQSALSWAVRQGLLARMRKIEFPRGAKGVHMRSRPITGEECDRMTAAVPKVRKFDAKKWQRFLKGLWLSGLRISEALELSWEGEAGI